MYHVLHLACTCHVVTLEHSEQFQNDIEHSRLSLFVYKCVRSCVLCVLVLVFDPSSFDVFLFDLSMCCVTDSIKLLC